MVEFKVGYAMIDDFNVFINNSVVFFEAVNAVNDRVVFVNLFFELFDSVICEFGVNHYTG